MALNPSTTFMVEIWLYLGFSLMIVAIRSGARWRQTGFKGLAPDDYLAILAGLLFTTGTTAAYFVETHWHGLANNAMSNEQRAALDADSDEYHQRVRGSQTHILGWLTYATLHWCLKLCWLFFFRRLGYGVSNMALKVNVGFAAVGVTSFGVFFTILCSCWSIYKKWQIYPDPGDTCYPAVSRVQVWTTFWTNLTTDLYIMSIPLPMIWSARIPGAKKLVLSALFCGGLVTVTFGGLRSGSILSGGAEGPRRAAIWSCRELFVAMLVTNPPILIPSIRHGVRRASLGCSTYDGSGPAGAPGIEKSPSSLQLTTIGGERRKKAPFKHPFSLPGTTFYERYGSEDNIVEGGEESAGATKTGDGRVGEGIVVTTRWEVKYETLKHGEVMRKNFWWLVKDDIP
ncbi:hypothetical protein CEP51_014547 [Fusarium floridanum]|uniref:Rhodopsin domain-containing protein n=1 Tax=Fusarium floridanum TaxID=1325733 RepID=A0A428PQR8_9HYPO|nr:hypothetical protein CEP51_014547 [Fusarium floridanum]